MVKPTNSHSTTLAPSSATMSMAARIVSTGENRQILSAEEIIFFATPRKNWEVCLSESGDGAIFSLLSPHLEEVKSKNAFDHLRHLLTLITNQNVHYCLASVIISLAFNGSNLLSSPGLPWQPFDHSEVNIEYRPFIIRGSTK